MKIAITNILTQEPIPAHSASEVLKDRIDGCQVRKQKTSYRETVFSANG